MRHPSIFSTPDRGRESGSRRKASPGLGRLHQGHCNCGCGAHPCRFAGGQSGLDSLREDHPSELGGLSSPILLPGGGFPVSPGQRHFLGRSRPTTPEDPGPLPRRVRSGHRSRIFREPGDSRYSFRPRHRGCSGNLLLRVRLVLMHPFHLAFFPFTHGSPLGGAGRSARVLGADVLWLLAEAYDDLVLDCAGSVLHLLPRLLPDGMVDGSAPGLIPQPLRFNRELDLAPDSGRCVCLRDLQGASHVG